MSRKRVYISSTHDDLIPHRRAAASIVEHFGHTAVDSYKAGAKPTVQQCLDDVLSCDIYLGIIGLRYGWIPADGDGRSITHREFDAAGEKLRLMFVMEAKHADLADPIKRFREKLGGLIAPAQFSSLDDFSAMVRKSLRGNVGEGESIGLLPYYCDRSEHYDRIDDLLWKRRQENKTEPAILVVHGDELQSGSEFIQVLVEMMPGFPAIKGSCERVTAFNLDWPAKFEQATFRARLLQGLAKEVLGNRHASREEIERSMQAFLGPVVIHANLSTNDWEQSGETAVLEFFRFWDEWPALARVQPVMIVLRVEYEVAKGSVFQALLRGRSINRINTAIKKFLNESFPSKNTIFVVLDELPRVARDAAEKWARSKQVREFSRGANLEPEIRELYRNQFMKEPQTAPRMDPLAKELTTILKAHG